MELLYVKLSARAYAPTRATPLSVGLDLKSADHYIIPPQERILIPTKLKIMIPEGHYGRIAPRSGLALKHRIDVCAGVIDSDNRGEIKILLANQGKDPFEINPGDKIAQLICEKVSLPIAKEVKDLPDTIRGDHGFGSSGKF